MNNPTNIIAAFLGLSMLSAALLAGLIIYSTGRFGGDLSTLLRSRWEDRAYHRKMNIQYGEMALGWLNNDKVRVERALYNVRALSPTLGRELVQAHMRRPARVGTGSQLERVP
jgi:uncharacterized FAD-dependent dehydrogenase